MFPSKLRPATSFKTGERVARDFNAGSRWMPNTEREERAAESHESRDSYVSTDVFRERTADYFRSILPQLGSQPDAKPQPDIECSHFPAPTIGPTKANLRTLPPLKIPTIGSTKPDMRTLAPLETLLGHQAKVRSSPFQVPSTGQAHIDTSTSPAPIEHDVGPQPNFHSFPFPSPYMNQTHVAPKTRQTKDFRPVVGHQMIPQYLEVWQEDAATVNGYMRHLNKSLEPCGVKIRVVLKSPPSSATNQTPEPIRFPTLADPFQASDSTLAPSEGSRGSGPMYFSPPSATPRSPASAGYPLAPTLILNDLASNSRRFSL